MKRPAYDENGMRVPPGFRGTPVPAAFRPVGLPAGSTVRVRSRPGGPPPSLTVEDATGADLLTLTVPRTVGSTPCTTRPGSRRLPSGSSWKVRSLLGIATTKNPTIRIATDPTMPPGPP